MEQSDYLQRQIEEMGRVLAEIVGHYTGMRNQGYAARALEETRQQLHSRLDLDIGQVLGFSKEELADFINKRSMPVRQIEQLADFFTEAGEDKMDSQQNEAGAFLKTALNLLQIADEASQAFAFHRVNKKSRLEGFLDQLN